MKGNDRKPGEDVLQFWFPEDLTSNIDSAAHREHWRWRLHGGADAVISTRFAELTRRGATGGLAHWRDRPEGRLALIVILDQFSRSLWRGSSHAFAQDGAALSLTLAGLENGHYAALDSPWHKITFTQPLGHAEGPDHLTRIDRLIALRESIAADAPLLLRPIYHTLVLQARRLREIIMRFGRFPHRDAILGRETADVEVTPDPPHLNLFRE